MLSDSKVRQAGFIRNSSSRKILYQPQPQESINPNESDDSFSSFQYEGNSKVSYQTKEKKQNIQCGQVRSVEKKVTKPPSPHIPPKPSKKLQIKQPQFTNERLKNNFFQQPSNHQSKSKQKNFPMSKPPKQQFPRITTPQFPQHSFKHELQQVQNICNRIEGVKLMEGNFSFNPKTNKLKKEGNFIQKQSKIRNLSQNEQQISEIAVRKPKQNNYFNQAQNHKFQYDFESSSSQSENQRQEQQQEQSFGNRQQQRDDEVINYYQQQQIRKFQQPEITKTLQKNNFPQNYQQNQSHHHPYQPQNNSKRIQNQQSEDNDQQLITDYNKNDFGLSIASQMKKNSSRRNQNRIDQQGVIQKHGGICFEVDVKQFNQGTGNNLSHQSTKKPYSQAKKKKVNEKQQLLRRREMAKTYSKQARFRLFGFA